jgi:hypothetical protein
MIAFPVGFQYPTAAAAPSPFGRDPFGMKKYHSSSPTNPEYYYYLLISNK